MGRDPAEELTQTQYGEIANRLEDLAVELLAGAACHWASHPRTLAMSGMHGRDDETGNPAVTTASTGRRSRLPGACGLWGAKTRSCPLNWRFALNGDQWATWT
jgi:hypothetical protein